MFHKKPLLSCNYYFLYTRLRRLYKLCLISLNWFESIFFKTDSSRLCCLIYLSMYSSIFDVYLIFSPVINISFTSWIFLVNGPFLYVSLRNFQISDSTLIKSCDIESFIWYFFFLINSRSLLYIGCTSSDEFSVAWYISANLSNLCSSVSFNLTEAFVFILLTLYLF